MNWCWIALPLTVASALYCLPANADEDTYKVTPLVTDKTDGNLVNPWGIAFNPNAFVWIADNGTGTSTLYDGAGKPALGSSGQPVVVTIPQGKPTGLVFNGTMEFTVNGKSTPFIFSSETGVISAWAPAIDFNNAQQVATRNAIYKGLALAANGKGNFLYATDFKNAKIDVFDGTFQDALALHKLQCDFRVEVPRGFAPFGIHNVNGDLYVTYAKQDADKEDDVAGRGLGLIVVFDADGCLVRRFAGGWPLNAPWGIALAPADFGRFGNRLLVGNFGDGTINAFDLHTGVYIGTLRGPDHRPLHIDGLWGLRFGNGVLDQGADSLFFTAGPDDETGGLYGRIDPVPRRH
jgi:uncharacterized protein (TIGR03118 family)